MTGAWTLRGTDEARRERWTGTARSAKLARAGQSP